MPYNLNIHHRQSIRLRDYDYAQQGAYFITVCTAQKLPLFGNVVDGVIALSDVGDIAHDEWQNIPAMRPYEEPSAISCNSIQRSVARWISQCLSLSACNTGSVTSKGWL